MEKLYQSVDDVISMISNSFEYQSCLSLKKKMMENDELSHMIQDIKKLQKDYIKSNYDPSIKSQLDQLEEKVSSIPIYYIYNQNLEKVNEMISYVNDSLNDYFYHLMNDFLK